MMVSGALGPGQLDAQAGLSSGRRQVPSLLPLGLRLSTPALGAVASTCPQVSGPHGGREGASRTELLDLIMLEPPAGGQAFVEAVLPAQGCCGSHPCPAHGQRLDNWVVRASIWRKKELLAGSEGIAAGSEDGRKDRKAPQKWGLARLGHDYSRNDAYWRRQRTWRAGAKSNVGLGEGWALGTEGQWREQNTLQKGKWGHTGLPLGHPTRSHRPEHTQPGERDRCSALGSVKAS